MNSLWGAIAGSSHSMYRSRRGTMNELMASNRPKPEPTWSGDYRLDLGHSYVRAGPDRVLGLQNR